MTLTYPLKFKLISKTLPDISERENGLQGLFLKSVFKSIPDYSFSLLKNLKYHPRITYDMTIDYQKNH